ncbi:MAG: prepilin peptidase [Nanoarchaeota archaeon]|nr:prepilin peptidase [Nanoarchaeota archaeon]MBU1028196.1 prepilin peptidase [Nanoarchaeota archaeon]
MFEIVFLFALALAWLLFASIQDLRIREIANWLNFSLIIFILGFRFFYSLFLNESFLVLNNFFYQGLIGFGIFFIIGNMFYYGRFFAGGDAKLMMALGGVLAFSSNFWINIKLFITFFILFLFVGAFYGLVWSVFLGLRNFKDFKKEFLIQLKKNKNKIYLVIAVGICLMVLGFVQKSFFMLGVLIFILPYLYLYAKSVDERCLIKKLKVKDLREGDWLYRDVKVGKKLIKANWDGLSKKEIELLNKKSKLVLIRQGIPFSPVFFISFIILIYFWKTGSWGSFW